MKRAAWLAALLALPVAAAAPIQFDPGAIPWQPGPPSMPAGTQAAVLEGSPQAAAMFTLRLKVPAGAQIAPHWHPRNERVTVLAGAANVGFGDVFTKEGGTRIAAGGFYINPPRVNHYVWFDEETIVQITGMGPWELHFVAKEAGEQQ